MNPQKKYSLVFLAVFGTLVCALLLFSWGRGPHGHFSGTLEGIGDNEFLISNGAREIERVALKLRHFVSTEPPEIGLFGSHVVQYVSGAPLGLATDEFMNYFVMHLGLPGILDMLHYLEHEDVLPGTFVVHLQHPHSANWDQIVYRMWEMPIGVYLFHSDLRITKRVRNAMRMAGSALRQALDIRFLTYSLSEGAGFACEARKGIITVEDAQAANGDRTPELVSTVGRLLHDWTGIGGVERVFIRQCDLLGGFAKDGSVTTTSPAQAFKMRDGDVPANPLGGGTEQRILSYMERIRALGQRNGRRVVFFAPPLFEAPRETGRSRMMDRTLKMAGDRGMEVIDHRSLRAEESLFFNALLMNTSYLDRLLTDAGLRR